MNKRPLRVSIDLTLQDMLDAMGAKVPPTHPTIKIKGVCLDSRAIEKGDVFFALRSARDGHAYISSALDKGASYIVVDHDTGHPNQIIVGDTLKALQDLALWHRQQWAGQVLGISGSNGKTTTKEMTRTLFGKNAFSTPGTWNNHLGIPLSLLMLRDHQKVAILEMGISNFGELDGYCSYARPDMGVLTVIGDSHLMQLKNREGVLKAKSELFYALPKDGTAIALIDDPFIHTLKNTLEVQTLLVSATKREDHIDVRVTQGHDQSKVEVVYGNHTFECAFKLKGQHNRSNLACALGLALACKLPADFVQGRIPLMQSFEMRMQEVMLPSKATVILDCYNANPTSTLAGIQAVSDMQGCKKILLGDMLELGDMSSRLHMDIGQKLYAHGFEQVFLIGQFAKDYYQGALLGGIPQDKILIFQNHSDASTKIHSHLKPSDILYVKGSRGMRLERIVEPWTS